jgi:hypothetical protein
VLGTPLFMAPEIVSDLTHSTRPSTGTDLHSLAVLLFYALCMGHPLEGAQSDMGLRSESWLLRHFGTHPVFAFDPDDATNRPVSEIVRSYWDLYPEFIRALFIQAFTEGLQDRHARVTEGEWLRALRRLRDAMTQCSACDATNFLSDSSSHCRSCGRPLSAPYVLAVGRQDLPVSAFTEVRTDHLMTGSWVEGGPTRIATVRRHPKDDSRWGLHNVSERTWSATLPDGRVFSVEPKDTVELLAGLKVDLGGSHLEVRPAEEVHTRRSTPCV